MRTLQLFADRTSTPINLQPALQSRLQSSLQGPVKRSLAVLVGFGLLAGLPSLGHAVDPFAVACNTGGDRFGHAVATNGDFNGDGVNDIAVGAPCVHVRNFPNAGRVFVFSGANGKKLFSKRGSQIAGWYGAGVSFVNDINGDGRDELAVGSPGHDQTPSDDPDLPVPSLVNGGKVDVFHGGSGRKRFTVIGPNRVNGRKTGFGNVIAPLNDVNGDGRADFAVGASHDRKVGGAARPGRVYVISGRDGKSLGFRVGPTKADLFGSSLATAGDIDDDGLTDFIAGTQSANVFQVRRGGLVEGVSPVGLEEDDALHRTTGAKRDGVGVSVDGAPDMDGDGVPDFIAGSDRSDDVDGIRNAGLVTLFAPRGQDEFAERLWVVEDESIQEKAFFGSAVATIGDMNHDGIPDFAAAAVGHDVGVSDTVRFDAGRVVALDGVDGDQLWATNGGFDFHAFGHAIDGSIDWNQDHSGDVAVGGPGDWPLGRRGAGTVKLLSGENGKILKVFNGRRGLETRIVAAAPFSGTQAQMIAFDHTGSRAEMKTNALEFSDVGDLSLAILNDRGRPHPKAVQVAIGTGANSTSSRVDVFRLGRRRKFKETFDAFAERHNAPAIENTGVNIAAGQVDEFAPEDLACAQADATDGNVEIRLFRRLEENQPFFLFERILDVFVQGEEFFDTNGQTFYLINAGGATIAMGDVVGNSDEEIIVGTTDGVPIVRILARDGTLLSEFLAYPPEDHSGVEVALIDIDGGGDLEIVTAPRVGPAEIKVYNGSGERVGFGRLNTPIFIPVTDSSFTGGARVAGADVDLDGQQEILVMLPVPLGGRTVRAFNRDGSEISENRYKAAFPFPNFTLFGGALAGTDLFVRD